MSRDVGMGFSRAPRTTFDEPTFVEDDLTGDAVDRSPAYQKNAAP